MSHYGSPGGPYPGPQPWPDRQPDDAYEEPSDPWGAQDPWNRAASPATPVAPASPAYGPEYGGYPASAYSGYPADQNYSPTQHYEPSFPSTASELTWPPPEPPAKSGTRTILALVVAIAVLVIGGGGTAVYLLTRDDGPAPPQPTGQVSAGPSPTGEPSASVPTPQLSTNALFVKVGQCVKNEGSDSKPKLVITECGAKTYEVLARVDGVTKGGSDARAKCARVTGYTDWYFFNSELDTLDFVLCLKKR